MPLNKFNKFITDAKFATHWINWTFIVICRKKSKNRWTVERNRELLNGLVNSIMHNVQLKHAAIHNWKDETCDGYIYISLVLSLSNLPIWINFWMTTNCGLSNYHICRFYTPLSLCLGDEWNELIGKLSKRFKFNWNNRNQRCFWTWVND